MAEKLAIPVSTLNTAMSDPHTILTQSVCKRQSQKKDEKNKTGKGKSSTQGTILANKLFSYHSTA
jgi:hypothetical protein